MTISDNHLRANLAAQQCRFKRWQHTYNHARPHESLDQQTPADSYQPSARRLVEHDKPLVYPRDQEVIVLFSYLPSILTPGLVSDSSPDRVLARVDLALEIDRAMRAHAPAGWKGDETREKQVLNALFPIISRGMSLTSLKVLGGWQPRDWFQGLVDWQG